MRIVVLHQDASEEATVDERDVLNQRDAVIDALARCGHDVTSWSCTLDLSRTRRRLEEFRPDVVFNLVESLGGTDRLMPLATLLLESLALPHTGSGTRSILATSEKVRAKERLRELGLPTPDWVSLHGDPFDRDARPRFDRPWILKTVWEHASFGIQDESVLTPETSSQLRARLREREGRTGRPHFAEPYIEGREFNVSLLASAADPNEPVVLPIAEIDFSRFPPGKPRIVGHSAKWSADSFEFESTPRCFDDGLEDAPLRERLGALATRCWSAFDIGGYARVDFRVDPSGQPWILEVNVNPCLTPDAGFAAALARAGISYDDAMERIVDSSIPAHGDPGCTRRS
ncbi:MAG: D-alanine--D-alanine ligase [Planctomycetes bacterium]|nr:D-alanine--D-alanine ligase [Planctomycetota bacterium]